MMNYGSSPARRLAAVPESVELDSSAAPSLHWRSSYRDSIRSVSIGPSSRSARFYPRNDSESSHGSSISSHATSYCSGFSSIDGMATSFPGWGTEGFSFSGVHELRAIALEMVNDGYIRGIIRAFSGGASSSVEAHGAGGSPDHEKLIVERWFAELDVEWILHFGADSAVAVGKRWLEPPSIFTEQEEEGEGEEWTEITEETSWTGGCQSSTKEPRHRCVGCSAFHTGEGEGGGMVQQLPLDLESLLEMTERWVRALLTMVHVLFITHLKLRAKRSTVGGVRKAIQYIQMLVGMAATPAGAATGEAASSEHEEEALFARFAAVSVLRMLAFVDVVSDAAPTYHWAPEALPGMLQVYACVADALPTIMALFKEATVFEGMNVVFLRKRTKLSNTIWSMMDMVRASFFTGDSGQQISLDLRGPGVHETTRLMMNGVHEITRLMMNYVALLWSNQGALNFVLQDHHFSVFVSEDEAGFNSVVNLIVDMISCLEKHLVDTSRSTADHGLRYIFMMNNCDFISQQVRSLHDLPSWFPSDDSKIQRYIDAYLHASWTPVLSCLYIDIPFGLRLRRYSSPSKFESGFRTVCNSQRLWKVPDPELRKRLRKAVIEKVIPCYTRYLEQRSATGKRATSPSSTPHELQEVLEELFEG